MFSNWFSSFFKPFTISFAAGLKTFYSAFSSFPYISHTSLSSAYILRSFYYERNARSDFSATANFALCFKDASRDSEASFSWMTFRCKSLFSLTTLSFSFFNGSYYIHSLRHSNLYLHNECRSIPAASAHRSSSLASGSLQSSWASHSTAYQPMLHSQKLQGKG